MVGHRALKGITLWQLVSSLLMKKAAEMVGCSDRTGLQFAEQVVSSRMLELSPQPISGHA